jgi:hypothetical protein
MKDGFYIYEGFGTIETFEISGTTYIIHELYYKPEKRYSSRFPSPVPEILDCVTRQFLIKHKDKIRELTEEEVFTLKI